MKNSLLILSVLFLSSSCATIMTGKTQEVTFDSEPQGAEVTVNGRVIGKTPTTIQLDKKTDQSVSFKLEGYKTQTRTLETKVSAWFMGNIVLGGLLPSAKWLATSIAVCLRLISSYNIFASIISAITYTYLVPVDFFGTIAILPIKIPLENCLGKWRNGLFACSLCTRSASFSLSP